MQEWAHLVAPTNQKPDGNQDHDVRPHQYHHCGLEPDANECRHIAKSALLRQGLHLSDLKMLRLLMHRCCQCSWQMTAMSKTQGSGIVDLSTAVQENLVESAGQHKHEFCADGDSACPCSHCIGTSKCILTVCSKVKCYNSNHDHQTRRRI
jgi:hypothetical protein